MKKDSIGYKVVLLGVLCAVCGLLLSLVNGITEPVIAKASLESELANLELLYPGADFTEVTDYDDPTGLVTGVYEAEGEGMVFKIHAVGYNSNGFTIMVSIDNDGKISGFQELEQAETSGFGARCFEDEYKSTITSLTVSDDVPLLSGATLTSTAIHNGINAAKDIFNASK